MKKVIRVPILSVMKLLYLLQYYIVHNHTKHIVNITVLFIK